MLQIKDGDLTRMLILRAKGLNSKLYKIESSSGTYNKQDPTHYEKMSFEFTTEYPVFDEVEDKISTVISIKWKDVTWGEDLDIIVKDNIDLPYELDNDTYSEFHKHDPKEYPEETFDEYLENLEKKAESNSKRFEVFVNRDFGKKTDKDEEFSENRSSEVNEATRKLILNILTADWYPPGYSFQPDPMGTLSDYE